MTAPDRIWYNGHTQHMRELRHSPPTSNAHPQVEYIRADLAAPAPDDEDSYPYDWLEQCERDLDGAKK